MKEFLSIGTVVLLKGTSKKIMIIGRVQICEKKAYHYSGVLYPEGYVGKDALYVFNEEDIEQVFHRGMEGEEEDACQKRLYEKLNYIENLKKSREE